MTVKETLLHAAKLVPPGSFDDQVLLNTDLCLFLLTDAQAGGQAFVDVPVDRVMALGRKDFLRPGDSWRDAVSRLTCERWSDSAFAYFDAPLLEESFPAPASGYDLRLACTGGVCYVTNGNHRLVAGRAWLAAKNGSGAKWKQANVRYEPLTGSAHELLKRAEAKGLGLRVSHTSEFPVMVGKEVITRFAVLNDEPMQLYALGTHRLYPLPNPWYFRFQWQWALTPFAKLAWKDIPAALVPRLLDDAWLISQLQVASSEAQPVCSSL